MDNDPSLSEVIQRHAADAAFGQPVIQNNLRGLLVEAMVDMALPGGWRWCARDWAAWDFEHEDNTRLEVKQAAAKQTAAKQTWASPARPSPPRFDIAERTGRWEGAVWFAEPGRNAHIYIFAYHPVADGTADQRDPKQWRFYVIETKRLPPTRSISLRVIERLAHCYSFDQLGARIEQVRLALVAASSPWEPA